METSNNGIIIDGYSINPFDLLLGTFMKQRGKTTECTTPNEHDPEQ